MKPKAIFHRFFPISTIVLACAFATQAAMAETYTWNPTAAGTYQWDDATSNWTSPNPPTTFPNAIDDTATITKIPTGVVTINLNQAITVGTLNIGANQVPTSGTGLRYNLNANGGSLIMDVSEGNATIAKSAGASLGKDPDTIAANILLNDNLTLYSGSTDVRGFLTINGIISGSGKSVTKTGNNLVRLIGAQPYDGGTTIDAGTLQLGAGTSGNDATLAGSILINAGGTLGINNFAGQTLAGANYSGAGILKKTGPGPLTLSGTWSLGSGGVGGFHVAGSANTAIVDAEAVPSFTFNGTHFYVGAGPTGGGTMTGILKLGILSNITANQVTIGGLEPDFNGDNGHAGLVTTLTDSITTINAANMAIGTGKAGGTQITGQTGGKFTLGSNATLNLYGLTGNGSRAALVLGRSSIDSSPRGQGTMDLSAGTANLILSELSLGRVTATNGLGGATTAGTLTLGSSGSNHLDISGDGSVVKIGYATAGGTGMTLNGTLTINNLDATSSITSTDNSTAILIGYESSDTPHTINGTLNLNGGMLTITTGGAAIASEGAMSAGVSSTLNLSGGATLKAGAASTDWIHSLKTATLGSGGATIDTNGNALGISQVFSGTGGLTKAGAGTLTLSGVNTYTGNTTVAAGALVLADNAGLKFVVTDASSNQITGAGSATLEGDFTIDTTAVTVTTGSWQLVDTGSQSFTSTFTVAGAGWSENANVWTMTDGNNNTWKFSEGDGTLKLNDGAPPADDYVNWDNEYAADLSDKNADNDGDGLTNFEEYAFGLNPTSGASVNPITDLSTLKSGGTFSYTRRAGTGLDYTVWTSTTLLENGWTEDVTADQEAGAVVNGVETVTVTLTNIPTDPKFFIRVKAD